MKGLMQNIMCLMQGPPTICLGPIAVLQKLSIETIDEI